MESTGLIKCSSSAHSEPDFTSISTSKLFFNVLFVDDWLKANLSLLSRQLWHGNEVSYHVSWQAYPHILECQQHKMVAWNGKEFSFHLRLYIQGHSPYIKLARSKQHLHFYEVRRNLDSCWMFLWSSRTCSRKASIGFVDIPSPRWYWKLC